MCYSLWYNAPTMLPAIGRQHRGGCIIPQERRPCCAVALRRTAWSEHGMASVNQTRPHCVNQVGKTHSKPLATQHGRGTAWARHGHGMLCVNRPLVAFITRYPSFIGTFSITISTSLSLYTFYLKLCKQFFQLSLSLPILFSLHYAVYFNPFSSLSSA